MRLTDLIIKRFYQDLEQNKEHRNSAGAGFDDIEDLDLALTLALEDIENIGTSYQALFSHTCDRTLRLGETCALGSKELAVLLNEMKYAALEQLGDVIDPFAAIDTIERCAAVHIEDLDGVDHVDHGAAADEQITRLCGAITRWFYRWLDSDDDGTSEVSSYSLPTFKDACQLTERLLYTCGLHDGVIATVFEEMKCAALERLPDYDEAIEAIEVINGLEEACCYE